MSRPTEGQGRSTLSPERKLLGSAPPLLEVTAMSPAPPPSRPVPRRTFEPARGAQQHLARAYEQLLPRPRRPLPRAGAAPAGPTPVARAAAV